MAGNLIKNPELVRGILEDACARHEFLILVTPYLRYESHFLGLEGDAFHVSATMSREDALYGLKNADLKFRFPNGTSFLEGPTRMLGLGLIEGRKTLKLARPRELAEGDQRGAYRVERVGKVEATLSTRKFDLWTAHLVDISTTGVRLLAPRDLGPDQMKAGDELSVSITLNEDIRINAKAQVRHLDTRQFGLAFHPPLEDPVQTLLSRWVFQRREEDQDRVTRRSTLAPVASGAPARSAAEPHGLLLVSSSEALEADLKEVLKEVQPLSRVSPHVQGLKEGLAAHPTLIFFHVPSLNLDDRRRLKALIEAAGRVPFMVLGGEGLEMSPLLELGTELKAAATYQWGPGKGAFFSRLVQGILRRFYEDREGPLAPASEEG